MNVNKEKIYNTSNVYERRKFLGIDVDVLKDQEFSLKNKEEVIKFTELIKNYLEEEIHLPFHWIDLPCWFDKCMMMEENGGRLFFAILDLKITFAFVFIDFHTWVYATISCLDERFRTAEVHQTGRMRKWVLGGRDCFVDNVVELSGFFNSILSLSDWLDTQLEEGL